MQSSRSLLSGVLFVLLFWGASLQAAEGIAALELAELAPAELKSRFAELRTTYRGQDPDELLLFIEMVSGAGRGEGDELEEDLGGGLDGTEQKRGNRLLFVEQAVDLLVEWPTPALSKAILDRLDGDGPSVRFPALVAGRAAADDPRVAARLAEVAASEASSGREVVLALRALSGSASKATGVLLRKMSKDPRSPVAEAARVSLREARVARGGWTPPALGSKPAVPTFCVLGSRSILSEFNSLPVKPLADPAVDALILLQTRRNRNPRPWTPQALKAMTAVLKRGGTVVISLESFARWPDPLLGWAGAVGITLPAKSQTVLPGPGLVGHEGYASFAIPVCRQNLICWKTTQSEPPERHRICVGNSNGCLTLPQGHVRQCWSH
ncbi:MAG: hypothetical protein ACYTGH_19555 [Planctomycetota bacterium]|jgi:hypothetical protein